MRGANCWTDHYMVRAKLRMTFSLPANVKKHPLPFAVHRLARLELRESYVQSLAEKLTDWSPASEDTAEECWNQLHSSITCSAEEIIGRGVHSSPEWFEENVDVLEPLIQEKNQARSRYLQVGTRSRKHTFRRLQRLVQKAVSNAKREWILKVATAGEEAVKDGRTRWDCIHKLQRVHCGRRPVRPTAILKNDGQLTKGPEEVLERWYQHFRKVLNLQSIYDDEVIATMPTLEPILHLDDPPSMEELEAALSRLKPRKAGGLSGILPELILCGGPVLRDKLLTLMRAVWREGEVFQDWRDAVIVPVPKKGNLQSCDNWRGISLLDVVEKVLGRIIQNRLQVVAETLLADSQCGFRKGRGCVDMIFVARQLMEKAREHGDSLFIMFVDLKKAYDSVPRNALWTVLTKCGVPSTMLSIIRSFHDGMQAGVRVGGTVTDSFEVRNGLRQGCTMAPVLFNVYFNAMVGMWRGQSGEAGVPILYRHGRRLVGDRTAKSRLLKVHVTESQFADDLAMYTVTREALVSASKRFVRLASCFGLTVSLPKTKGLAVGSALSEDDVSPVSVDGGQIEMVHEFTYLGSKLSYDGEITPEVSCRIARASKAFGCLREPVFLNRTLSTDTKRAVYKAVVVSILLYGAETWTLKAPDVRRLNSFHNRCVRTILGVTRFQQWQSRITSRRLSGQLGLYWSIADFILQQRLKWLGHLGRMNSERLPKQLLFGELVRKRPFHGTKKRWRDEVMRDLKAISIEDWYTVCQDRERWSSLCAVAVDEVAQCREENTCTANRASQERNFICICGRRFRRSGDLTRHRRFCDE